ALIDPSWIETMQDELLQFKLQKVWTLVDLPYGKRAIGTKWVYKNKRRMDVKSAFLYGTIEEEVYVCQPLRFRRGAIDKTLFIKKDKGDILLVQVYVDDIIFGSTKKSLCTEFEQMMHKRFHMSSMGELTFFLGLQKFDFATMKTASTPMETNKALLKDEEAANVDVHLYRSMIGSLMYLKTSRPNIMFAVCACARFLVTPKTSHLHAVKRIFKYLKGHPKLGIWYPRDSPFELEPFSDSDYAGASLDRKSTIGGCQFLRKRLISWQCKKQTIVANSTTKVEYVAAANCYGQSSGPIPLIADETVIKELEDKMEGAATTTSSLEEEQDSGNINRTQSMATLNESFPQGTNSGSGPRCQDTILGGAEAQIRFKATSKQSNDPPLSRVNTLGSGEGSMKLKELMEFCTKLSDRVLALKNTNTSQAAEIGTLKERVKKLEKKRRSRTYKPRRLYKGRKIADLDADTEVTLIDETQGRNDEDLMFDTGVLNGDEVFQEPMVNTATTTSSIPV
ncbi:putative ribonuclease H-like domain-containing protein, partial [Tanacetum coccineum]